MCDASGTQLLDQARRDWCDDLLAACGIDRERLPRLVEGCEPSATLDTALAARWGLPEGVLFGLNPASRPGEVIRAVIEGVGFSLREAREVIERAGTPIERLAVIGGGTRSRYWLRLLASIIDRPLVRYRDSETGPAFGATRLARLAVTGESPETIRRAPPVDAVFEPEAGPAARYAEAFTRYRRLYAALAPEFREAMLSAERRAPRD